MNPLPNQVGIFWQTDEKETGWVIFGQNEGSLDKVALDEREIQDKRNLLYNHITFLKNLQPDSRYFYKIVSNNQLVEAEAGGAFTFSTPSSLSPVASLNPAYGKIIKENGEPEENAIVFLLVDQAYSLLTLTKSTGEWLIPLNTLLNKSTLKIQTVGAEDKLLIEILSDDKKRTQITTRYSSVSPLPQTVIMGKDYDFLQEDNILSAQAVNKGRASKIDILFPKDSAVIPGGKPIIKGTAIPGAVVEVSIDSAKSYKFKADADKDGVWSVVLTEELSVGTHTLKITTKDEKGKNVELTRKFMIAKSGEQVLGEATAGATATVTPSPSPSPVLSPTSISTLPVTESASPPVPGMDIGPMGAASASLIILGLGILLAF